MEQDRSSLGFGLGLVLGGVVTLLIVFTAEYLSDSENNSTRTDQQTQNPE